MSTSKWLVAAGVSCLVVQSFPVMAEEPGGIQWSMTPYLWAAGMEGEITTGRGFNTDIDQSFSDVLKDLDFAYMARFQGRTGRWLFGFEPMYLDIDGTEHPGNGPIDVKWSQKLFNGRGFVGYRVLETEQVAIEAIAGFRYWYGEASIKFVPPGIKAKKDDSWVDPVVGGRLSANLADRWHLQVEGSVEGFGAGSDLVWDFGAYATYDLSQKWTAFAGYRILDLDREMPDHTNFDVQMSGPLLGARRTF